MSNENPEICKSCGGICCKSMSGEYSPDDFKNIYEEIVSNKNISIDWWEGELVHEGVAYYSPKFPRARERGKGRYYKSWGSICVNLKKSGCALEFKNRPYTCRYLTPSTTKCSGGPSKRELVSMWVKHQKVLDDVVNKIEEGED